MYQYFEAEEQAKKLQQLFIYRIMKQVAFRKWAKISKQMKAEEKQSRNHIAFKDINEEDEEKIKDGEYEISDLVNEKEEKEEKFNKDSQNKPIVNLKFGDFIYLKYYSDNGQKGIISGDGIASNKLECLPQKLNGEDAKVKETKEFDDFDSNRSFSQKKDYLDSMAKILKQQESSDSSIFKRSAEQQFRKCLFRVINEKKYFYQEKLKKSKQIQQEQDTQHLDPKVEEEKKENLQNYERLKGTNICYGQVIQLVHLYSDCTLTLNPNVLAQQNCCREMSLEEVDNQWSNFMIVSLKNTKKFGEPVLYGDQIHFQSQMDKSYWLNIDNIAEGSLDTPLEVNASEFNTPLKLCNYLDFKTSEERENNAFKGKILQSGEVVRLFNRSLNGYIGVKRSRNLVRILQKRTVTFVEDNSELKMEQEYFDRVKSIDSLQKNFVLYVHQKEDQNESRESSKLSKNLSKKMGVLEKEVEIDEISQEKQFNVDIQTLWEIQKEDSFSSQIPSHKGFYYLKNLASGLYLSVGHNTSNMYTYKRGNTLENSSFALTFETSPSNLFRLPSAKSTKKVIRDESIQYNNSIMIQGFADIQKNKKKQITILPENIKTLVLYDRKDGDKTSISVECVSRLEKQSKEKYTYEILSVNKDLRQTTDRVSSLFPFLLDFYIFLQDWGHSSSNDVKEIRYTYKQAFDNQKQLFNKVLEFSQSIDNLQEFLKVEDSTLLMRQDVIRESGLLTLLILVLQQIDFKIYGKLFLNRDKATQERNQIISERSAQKIAQQKLKKNFDLLHQRQFKILLIPNQWQIILKLLPSVVEQILQCNFRLSGWERIINFCNFVQYQDVKSLIREAIKWMEESDEKEKQNIRDWCDKISNITSQKLGIQIFVMEILSLSMVNPMEEAIEENQKFCKRLLFKATKESKSNVSSMDQIGKARVDQNQYFNLKLEQKKLISFILYEDRESQNKIPCVIYNLTGKSATKVDFEKENQKLKWIQQYRDITAENQSSAFPFPFYVKNEYEEMQQVKVKKLKKYDQYVISVLNFYAQMCKGRNIKVIRILKSPEIGLTDEFITTCIKLFNPFDTKDQSPQIKKLKNLEYYRCFLALYQETILDTDPLLRISESKVNSMVRKDIQNFQISDKSYKLFHDFVLSEERNQYITARLQLKPNTRIFDKQDNDDEEEYQEIRKFADEIVNSEDTTNKISYQIMNILFKGYNSNDLKSSVSIFKENEEDVQLKTILQMLKIVHSRIDLGYNDLYTNSHIIKSIHQIFLAYISYKSPETKSEKNNQSWIFDLLVESFKGCKDAFLITRVVLEASKIIQVLDVLQRNLIIVSQIQQNMGKKLRIKFKQSKVQKGALDMGDNQIEIEMVNLLKNESNEQVIILTTENIEEEEKLQKEQEEKQMKEENDIEKQSQNKQGQGKSMKNRESYEEKFKRVQVDQLEFDLFRQSNMQKLKKTKDQNFKIQDLSIGTILFETLKYSQDNPTLQNQLSEQLINYIQQNKILINLFDQIEIIDDEFELQLLRDICGDTQDQISAKDMAIFANKIVSQLTWMKNNKVEANDYSQPFLQTNQMQSLHTVAHSTHNQMSFTNLNSSHFKQKGYLQDFSDGLQHILELFKLESYEECKKTMNLAKSKEDYFSQLQNLLRNTGFHRSVLLLVQNSSVFVFKETVEVKDDDNGTYKNLYSSIIEFLYLFVKDNTQNRLEVLPYFNKVLELALFQYEASKTHDFTEDKSKNRPLKINKLCTELLQDKKEEIDQIKQYITIIFENIDENKPEDIGQKIEKPEDQKKSIMRKQAICQYLKILTTLTTSDYNKCIKQNQQKIMDNILNSKALKNLSKPFTSQQIEKLNAARKKNSKKFTQTYYIFKMHELCLTVLACCCKNHKLLIQEIHRMVSSDSLKNNFTLPSTPYMLKRAYLKLMFETYIQKDDSSKFSLDLDVMPSDEIAEVIELIYKIVDDKNNYLYLEGLVKINPKLQNECWDLRTHILQEKAQEKKAEFSTVTTLAKKLLIRDNKINKSAAVNGEYEGILKDPSEYWKFLLDEGVIQFLTDTFDERIYELGQQQKSTTLKEQYAKIKKMFANIIDLFNKLETSYRTKKDFISQLYHYKQIMLRVNDIIPKYKSQKGGESYKIGVTTQGKVLVQTYNTRKEDLQGGGFQDVEDDNKNDCEFYKFLRLFLMRNRLNVQDFCNNIVSIKKGLRIESTKPILKDVISTIMNRDKQYVTDLQIIEFLEQECMIAKVLQRQYITISTNEEQEEITDFIDQNISTIISKVTKNLDRKKGPQDIAELDKEEEDDHHNKDVIPPKKLVSDLDIVGLKENLKMKLLKQAQINLKIMGEALNTVEMEQTPFTNYESSDRIMEEVYITQILLEMIKKPEIDLFCQKDIKQNDEIDTNHIKNLTDSVTQYIEATKKIFENKSIYLIKFVRVILELKQINQDTIEDKTNKDKVTAENANRAVQEYKLLQTIVGKSKIHEQVINKIIKPNYQNESIESLVLLNQLLNFGNVENQAILLNYLKEEKEICLDFFSYLRDFFQNKSSYNLIQIKESRRKVPKQTVYFEVHSYLILRILQLCCENVNERFQNFLRQQNDNMGIYSANTNVIMETSNFLSFLLEDSFVSMECKSKLIRQCLETLVDFSTGAGLNQTIICQNKRLFSFLQDKILNMKIDFNKPKIDEAPHITHKQESKIDMFISSIKFLMSMVQGNHEPETLIHILNHIEGEQMLNLMYKIYKERIKPIQKNLILEIQCPGKSNKNHVLCNDSVCIKGYTTDYDTYLYEIGFQIFIMFCYLMEVFPEEHALDPFTRLLDSKYDFSIFDFASEDRRRNNFISNFQDQLRNQSANKTKNQEKKVQQQITQIQNPQQNLLNKSQNEILIEQNGAIKDSGQPLLEADNNMKSAREINLNPIQKQKEKSLIVRIFTKVDKGERLDSSFKFDVNFNRIINQESINKQKVQDIKRQLYQEKTLGNEDDDDQYLMPSEKPKSLLKILLESIIDTEMMEAIPRYYFFFKNQVGITEIMIKDKIQLFYFQKPFCSNFLSPYIKNHLIYESNRESDEDRLLFLLDNFGFYYKQMIYKQYWFQHNISWFMENWRIIKDIQFFFLLLIVFLQLFFLEGSIGDNQGSQDLDDLTQALTVIQLILTFVVLVFCGIERFKISINRFTNADSWRKIQYLKENAGLTTETIINKIYKTVSYFQDDMNPSNYKKKPFFWRFLIYTLLIVSDIENFYHACYLVITVAGFFLKGPLVYGILLLDIVKRSHSLQQIIKSITQNLWNIFIFSYLGIIVMYIYGIGGYYYFKDDFEQENKAYNNTFISTVASVINMGLRNGGGISESMKNLASYTSDENVTRNYFWGRYFYDISFFILINMLFIQIIFGIILDTFEELRKEQDKIREEVVNKCFVCSMSRGYIDSNSEEGWYQHIYLHHNAYHLVFFLSYISRKDETECNYIEKYVKKQIEQKLINFIPVRQSTDVPEQEPIPEEVD